MDIQTLNERIEMLIQDRENYDCECIRLEFSSKRQGLGGAEVWAPREVWSVVPRVVVRTLLPSRV